MSRLAVYPGTFDPVTLGHLDLIRRSRRVFDQLVVAVAHTRREKNVLFSVEERVELLKLATADIDGVSVDAFDGLLVDYVRRRAASAVIRGLRAFSDFEYEFKMVLTNQKLDPDIETLFFMPSLEYSYINSNLVREIAAYGGRVEDFVPAVVAERLRARFGGSAGSKESRQGKPS